MLDEILKYTSLPEGKHFVFASLKKVLCSLLRRQVEGCE